VRLNVQGMEQLLMKLPAVRALVAGESEVMEA
jgi:hypothetical protein